MLKHSFTIAALSFASLAFAVLPAAAQIETFDDPYAGTPAASSPHSRSNPYNDTYNNGMQPYGQAPYGQPYGNNAYGSPPGAVSFTQNWGQPAINWAQLQSIFSAHPGVTLFIIHFPNGFNWKVDPSALQALYTNMEGTTTGMGLIGAGDLIFSSTTQQLTITCCISYNYQPNLR